ncbi:hypothetical protein A2U01_0104485, partial [Trifolium medium]|nr:hypothetical protein [Trifolium medium]
ELTVTHDRAELRMLDIQIVELLVELSWTC